MTGRCQVVVLEHHRLDYGVTHEPVFYSRLRLRMTLRQRALYSTHAHCTLWLTATSSSSSSSSSTRLCSRRRPQLGRWLDAPSVYVYLEAPAAVAVAGLIDRWRMICGNHVDMIEMQGGFGTLFVNLGWNSSFADYNRFISIVNWGIC